MQLIIYTTFNTVTFTKYHRHVTELNSTLVYTIPNDPKLFSFQTDS